MELKVLPRAKVLMATDGSERLYVDTGSKVIPVAANQQTIDLTILFKSLFEVNHQEQEISKELFEQVCASTSLDTVYKIPMTPDFAITIPLMETMANIYQSAETAHTVCARGTVFSGSIDNGNDYMTGYITIIAINTGDDAIRMTIDMRTI